MCHPERFRDVSLRAVQICAFTFNRRLAVALARPHRLKWDPISNYRISSNRRTRLLLEEITVYGLLAQWPGEGDGIWSWRIASPKTVQRSQLMRTCSRFMQSLPAASTWPCLTTPPSVCICRPLWWLGRLAVRALDSQLNGREFNFRPLRSVRCRVTTVGV